MNALTVKNPDPTFPTGQNPEGKRGLVAVLQIKDFRRLWIGQIFSQLADKFYIVLMVYLIAQYWVSNTPSGNNTLNEVAAVMRMDLQTRAQMITLLATGVYVANTIPAMFLGTIAGVWADRWPKRRVMVASNALRGILVIFTPICLLRGPDWAGVSWGYWALLGMTFLESVLTQFFAPAEQASIPLLVPNEHLLAANSLYQATSMGATIVGFALGDPILRLLKNFGQTLGFGGGEFLLLPFCYGIAAIIISRIRKEAPIKSNTSETVWNEIGEGLAIIKEKRTVRGAMFHLVLLYSLLAALYVLAISLASYIKELGPTSFGTLLAMSGIGMAFGALFMAQIGHKFSRRLLTAAGLSTISLTLILLGQLKGSLGFTLFFCAILGIGSALVAIPAQTTLQEDTPENKRGKVFGLQNNLINISLSLPLVLAGTLVTTYGLKPVLWILALIALMATLLERPWSRC